MKDRLYGTILCFLASFLRPVCAEPPNPVREAIDRLQAIENYSWSRAFETPGAPFTLAPASGWRTEGGHVTHEIRATTSLLQTVTLKNRAVGNAGAGWKALPDLVAAKGAHTSTWIELASYRSPGEELTRIWPATANPPAEADGAYVTAIDSGEALAAVTQLLRNRGPQRLGQAPPAVSNPSGTLRIWLKEGLPQKYVLTVAGSVALPFGNRQVTKISTVDLTLAGGTNAVPAEAKAKLQALHQP
jgi:hypothetical protein